MVLFEIASPITVSSTNLDTHWTPMVIHNEMKVEYIRENMATQHIAFELRIVIVYQL